MRRKGGSWPDCKGLAGEYALSSPGLHVIVPMQLDGFGEVGAPGKTKFRPNPCHSSS